MIEWHRGDPPRDRRTLMIVTTNGAIDIVVGQWHEAPEADISAGPPSEPLLTVLRWAELSDLPPGVELRELDFKGTRT